MPTADATASRLNSALVTFDLAIISGYMIFNFGLMLLRIPPTGFGLPIGELALFANLAAFFFVRFPWPRKHAAVAAIFATWWTYGLIYIAFSVPASGFWAIRDGAHVIESSFVIVGFYIAHIPGVSKTLTTWLRLTCWTGFLYVLCYPFQDYVANLSPSVSSMAGVSAPIFAQYANVSSLGVTIAFFFLTSPSRHVLSHLCCAGAVILVEIVFVQARMTYLDLAFMMALIFFLVPQRLPLLAGLVLTGVAMIGAYLASGIQIPGRLGQAFTLDFLVNHFAAIWGGGDHAVQAAADGVNLRLDWWKSILDRLFDNPRSLFFGLGFGDPLTAFRGISDDIVREPHNSLMSVTGREGVIGITLFAAIQFSIYRSVVGFVMATRRQHAELFQFSLCVLCFLGTSMIFSWGEGGFEVSYVAIPYYFVAGVIFGLSEQLGAETLKRPVAMPSLRPAHIGKPLASN